MLALAAKLIYALLLALVLVAATSLAALEIGWFATWLLQIAFWWGILIKRKELLGFLSVSGGEEERSGGRAMRWYANTRAARAAGEGAAAVATALPRRGGRALATAQLGRREAGTAATMAGARDELDRSADRARTVELDEARSVTGTRPALEEERRAVGRALRPLEDERVEAIATERQVRPPRPEERALLARRDALDGELHSDEMRRAEASVREADRAMAREGRPTSDAERAAWREQRRRDLQQGLALDHDRNLRAAGIDPREYRSRPPEAQAQLRERVREVAVRDTRLLAGVPERSERPPTTREAAEARVAIPPEELRRRSQEQRAAWHSERRLRRQRQHLYRR